MEFFYQKLAAFTVELPLLTVLVASNALLTSFLIAFFGSQKARNQLQKAGNLTLLRLRVGVARRLVQGLFA